MSEPTDPPSLEARVARIERHLNRRSWLDEPAEIDGVPFVMGDKFPLFAKVFLAWVVVCGVGVFGLLIYARFMGHG